LLSSPYSSAQAQSLEFKPDSKPHVERKIVTRGLRQCRWFQEVRIGRILTSDKIKRRVLIGPPQFLTVENVEEVGNELQLRLFGDAERIIRVDVKPRVFRRAALAASATHRNLTYVQVHRMRIESVDGESGFKVYVETKVQPIQSLEATFFSEAVAAEHIDDMPAIGVEWSNRKLVTQQIEVASRKVKQRTDSRISLTVIVAQMTFEITFELGNAPVEETLPTVREPAIQLDLERAVLPNRLRESVRVAIRRIDLDVSVRINSGLGKANTLAISIVEIVPG